MHRGSVKMAVPSPDGNGTAEDELMSDAVNLQLGQP
jgi:hypothetical protein